MKSYNLWITLESQSLATLILAINIPRLGQQRITEHYLWMSAWSVAADFRLVQKIRWESLYTKWLSATTLQLLHTFYRPSFCNLLLTKNSNSSGFRMEDARYFNRLFRKVVDVGQGVLSKNTPSFTFSAGDDPLPVVDAPNLQFMQNLL
jgi:hypothetical protein